MKKRLLLATIFMLTLPLWFSPDTGKTMSSQIPFTVVAEAGHQTLAGFYCDCNDPAHCSYNNPVVYRSEQSADAEADTAPDTDTALLDALMLLVRLLIF